MPQDRKVPEGPERATSPSPVNQVSGMAARATPQPEVELPAAPPPANPVSPAVPAQPPPPPAGQVVTAPEQPPSPPPDPVPASPDQPSSPPGNQVLAAPPQDILSPVAQEQGPVQAGKMRLVTIRLRQLPDPAEQTDEFGNRFPSKYKPEAMPDLQESIRIRGVLDPPVITRRKDDTIDTVEGHRRITCLYNLAKRGVPGFHLDMEVLCFEVLDASYPELVVRSIASNETSEKLDAKERLLAVKKASEAGVSKKEIAATTGITERQIDRDLKIVRNERILHHVLADNIQPTAAAALIEAATKSNRLGEFLDHLDAWTQLTREEIDLEERRAKQERGKGLPVNQTLVMSRLRPHIVRGWIESLAKGKPLAEEDQLGFEAAFDKKSAVATVKARVNAMTDDPDYIARVAGQISRVAKQLAAFAQKRRELEGPQGPQAALEQDDSLVDTELLRQFDLEDIAEQLNQELRGGESTPEP
jgi:ParB-like chromosome segregation protein Spo0J